MLSKNKIKYLNSLKRKKNRLIEKKILLEGYRIISEAVLFKKNIKHVWISNNIKSKTNICSIVQKLKNNKIDFSYEDHKLLQLISSTKNSQGIFALASINNIYNQDLNDFGKNVIILDQISDPGNLGTILRTCAWFGIKSIILSNNSADIFNDKCIRSAVGGHFYIDNFKYLSVNEIVSFLKINNYNILCADLQGQSINKIKPLKKWALILGSEAHGVDKNLKIGKKITITQIGNIESLNVSVACGIILNKLTYQ